MRKSRHPLDRQVQDKLGQWTPAYRPESWQQLSDRLDAADAEDAFDEQLTHDLQRIRVPEYSANSWAALAARLELEQQRTQTILHSKATEVCLLLLLLFVFWQHIPVGAPTTP
ncbi:MAG: hypothetical protein KDC54_21735, partial [Lewinella sp.]|nr:hypothetical protein [Lewinella sp.]